MRWFSEMEVECDIVRRASGLMTEGDTTFREPSGKEMPYRSLK